MIKNMENYIEHTLLKPDATNNDIKKLVEEAVINNFYGVCVNPNYVALSKKLLDGKSQKIVTVVGFPLGSSYTQSKVLETKQAIKDGADEIDMVINISALKNKDYELVKEDIKAVKEACFGHILKVILETDLLSKDEIKKACELCIESNANIVKTSTGFVKNGVGAKVEDIKLMSGLVKSHNMGVKASGGIRDKKKAIDLISAGA